MRSRARSGLLHVIDDESRILQPLCFGNAEACRRSPHLVYAVAMLCPQPHLHQQSDDTVSKLINEHGR